jgi:PIN domain nuclease of toxin-antitoxin system
LDTHILLWSRWFPTKLSQKHSQALRDLDTRGESFALSAISLWELAKMTALGRLEIDISLDAWLDEIENDPHLEVLPISARVALESTRLGAGFHRDPADQIIVATARCHALTLLTADERIRRWGKVPII